MTREKLTAKQIWYHWGATPSALFVHADEYDRLREECRHKREELAELQREHEALCQQLEDLLVRYTGDEQ